MRQIFSILSAEAGVGRYKTDCIIHTIRFPAPLTVFCHMRRKLFFEFFVTACRQPLPFRWAETLIAPNCESCGCPSMCSGFSANKREKKASIFFLQTAQTDRYSQLCLPNFSQLFLCRFDFPSYLRHRTQTGPTPVFYITSACTYLLYYRLN